MQKVKTKTQKKERKQTAVNKIKKIKTKTGKIKVTPVITIISLVTGRGQKQALKEKEFVLKYFLSLHFPHPFSRILEIFS